ncbi:hypothetical protein [Streptococcus hyointestinalis]|uniref:hypothetical protein n=1 Tax=Streptococcus hyointestinalis TaxID=1337 RepID=UPI0013DF675B|nr:hypothetical protein [Streptococcus hyointestinalis]
METEQFLGHNSKEALKLLLVPGRMTATESNIKHFKPVNSVNLGANIVDVDKRAQLIAPDQSIKDHNN